MQIFARHGLVTGRIDEAEPALLLEGTWPDSGDDTRRDALDDTIDARFSWIDDEASRVAEALGATSASHASLLSLNATRLRYQLVKWLRLVAWCEKVARFPRNTTLRLVLERNRDQDYGQLVRALADQHGWNLLTRWESPSPQGVATARPTPPANAWWRRWLSHLHRLTDVSRAAQMARPRVVLGGNPRHLDPVCSELLQQGARPWWLYERLAIGTWLRWRRRGVGQRVCDQKSTHFAPLPLGLTAEAVSCCGLDLRPIVQTWLEELAASCAAQQSQLNTQIEQALDTLEPHAVIVDQDATPFNRALVYAAKERGIRSLVVQHGVPFVSFGFAPLEADLFCAWGDTSRQQLIDWKVPEERIRVTGAAAHDSARGQRARTPDRGPESRPPRFLLLATIPPHDSRPDLIAYHCTAHSYEQMLRNALTVLSEYDQATVLIKPHPRDRARRLWHKLLHDFPALDALVLEQGTVEQYLVGADCVIACASSSGVEATLSGVPVVMLMPERSQDLIAAPAWGMLGTARSAAPLRALIDRALYDPMARCSRRFNPSIFGNEPRTAAAQIVEFALAAKGPSLTAPASSCVAPVHPVGS